MPPEQTSSQKRRNRGGRKKSRRKKSRRDRPNNANPLQPLLRDPGSQPQSKLNRQPPADSGSGPKKRKSWKRIFTESSEPFEKNVIESTAIPDGYVFVPRGNVYITRNCRSKTKKSKQMVYTVWDKTGKRSYGIRVPSSIHEEVLESAADTAESRAKIVEKNDTKITSRGRQLLREEFPQMPDSSLDVIVNHAFLKGSGRVGRTGRLDEKDKASLAVEAHIRHTLTPYDSLLKSGVDRKKARKQVLKSVRAIKKSWQGKITVEDEHPLELERERREESLTPSVISISSSSLSPRAESVVSVESEISVISLDSVDPLGL